MDQCKNCGFHGNLKECINEEEGKCLIVESWAFQELLKHGFRPEPYETKLKEVVVGSVIEFPVRYLSEKEDKLAAFEISDDKDFSTIRGVLINVNFFNLFGPDLMLLSFYEGETRVLRVNTCFSGEDMVTVIKAAEDILKENIEA